MGSLNNGYISKSVTLIKSKFLIIIAVVLLIGTIATIYIISRPTLALYKFNSGLSIKFDLNKWRLIPNSSSGDTLENGTQNISIYLTSARPEDSSKTLTEIVGDRISLLNKQNIEVKKELIKINSLDFYRIEYKDIGDENVKPDESSISFVTIYNGTYTTIQIFYRIGSNLNEVNDIINTINTIQTN